MLLFKPLPADLFPGDLNSFYYTCGGAEANEVAIRMAKILTGKHKIISRCVPFVSGGCACALETIREGKEGVIPTTCF